MGISSEDIEVKKVNIFPNLRMAIKEAITKPNWTRYELGCRITDLEWKYHFVKRSIDLFVKSYFLEDQYHKETGLRSITTALMDCYLYFEVFLFESKSFLDFLAGLYPRFLSFKGSSPKRSFNDFREWVLKKGLSQGLPKEIVEFFETQTLWFPLLREYRDMFTHSQGYNPMVGRSKDDGKLELKMCTIESPRSGNPHIGAVISTIENGIENLIIFTDETLSKYGLKSLKRFDDDTIGVFSIIEEESGRKVTFRIAVPELFTLESIEASAQTPFTRIRIEDVIDSDQPIGELEKKVIRDFESLGIKIYKV